MFKNGNCDAGSSGGEAYDDVGNLNGSNGFIAGYAIEFAWFDRANVVVMLSKLGV